MARVAVVGPGAIGATFAAAVQQAGGHELALCARTPRQPPVVEGDGFGSVALDAAVLTEPGELGGPVDWVLLAVKAHQTAGAAGWLGAACGPRTVVAVLQNGIEHREQVAPLAGDASVLPAIVWCPAETVEPGRVVVRGPARLSVPAGEEGRALATLMDGGPASVDLVEDFTTEAWRKLCMNAVAGLSVLAGRRSGVFRDAEVAELARRLGEECVAVGRAEGARLPDDLPDRTVAELAALPPDLGTSMLYDREAGRELEWDARNGVIRRLGAKHGIPTPISDVIVPLLAAASDRSDAA
jgi:2-dehydropantoate 2-reductase